VKDLPDEALFEGYAAGDPEASACFVRKFGPRLYGVALSITRDRRDAEEAAQDAFVRAWRYAASFDARRGTMLGWLLGIARNVALDRARVTTRRREQPVEHLPIDLPADGIDPEEAAGQSDLLARIVVQLSSLPEAQRDALVAASLNGLTTREIADWSGVPQGTVKTRIRAALPRLREQVQEQVACDQ
jgi:RNA polymerase sigma-70 factor (ECF subfamily)